MTPLHVFARITPKPSHYDDAREAICGILGRTREEKGCISFELFENEAEGALFLIEAWTDAAALEEHYAQPYTEQVFRQYEGWLARQPEIHKMQAV